MPQIIVEDWAQPRRVEEWWWMDLNRWSGPGVLDRCGRVKWNADGTGHYSVSLTFETDGGLGLYCYPDFRALSDAQEFVERLLDGPIALAIAENGRQWPGVVL
jgi:hypothetical protein